MKRIRSLILSAVLCLTIIVGYVAGTKQEASADDGPYGKYVLSADSVQYIELKPDGSCLIGARELTPSGTFSGSIKVFSGRYEIKGDILTFIGPGGTGDWRLEGNTLVPPKYERGTDRMKKAMEGAKYIKR